MTSPQVIAHRGNRSVTPENTLPAFVSALKSGCDAIEMDVVLTSDNVPVIIHNNTVDATTDGEGKVGSKTLDEIKQLDAGAWFSPAFTGTRIPTFTEFARLMNQHPGVDILLEFKGPWTPEQVELVMTDVRTYNLDEFVMLQSFHPVTIESIFTVAPTYRRGVLIETEPENLIERAIAAGIYTINPDVDYLFEHLELVDQVRDAGMRMQVWTANTPEQWERLVDLGVAGIITDRPDALVGWLIGRGLR